MTAPISAGDTAWVLVSSALVLLMLPGLALFYGGLVRARATLNTFMMSFAAVAVVTAQWVVFGYSLAFAEGGFAGGLEWVGLAGVVEFEQHRRAAVLLDDFVLSTVSAHARKGHARHADPKKAPPLPPGGAPA